MNEKERRICLICGEPYEVNTRGRHGRSNNKRNRGKDSLTCSHKCSKIYQRARDNIYQKYLRNLGRIKKELIKKITERTLDQEDIVPIIEEAFNIK